MNTHRYPGLGSVVVLLIGVLLGAGWLALSDPELAHALLASRSGADWLLMGGLVIGALVLVALGSTLWIAGAQLLGAMVKIGALLMLVALVVALAASSGSPGATELVNRCQDVIERFTQRGLTPVVQPARPITPATAPAPAPWWEVP